VIAAFNDLVLRRGFVRVTVRDIIAQADVGRSTFYEHFENKADVLEQSLAPIFSPLADVLGGGRDADAAVRRVAEHVWSSKKLAISVLSGATRPVVTRFLARLLEARMERGGIAPEAQRPLVAAALAAMQIGLLEAWVAGTAPASADAVARLAARMTRAAAAAVQPTE